MFGIKGKVIKVRDALVRAMQAKAAAIHTEFKRDPNSVPFGAVRVFILTDLVEILTNLVVDVKDDEG